MVSSSLSEFMVPGSPLFPEGGKDFWEELAEMRVCTEEIEEITRILDDTEEIKRIIDDLQNPPPLLYPTNQVSQLCVNGI